MYHFSHHLCFSLYHWVLNCLLNSRSLGKNTIGMLFWRKQLISNFLQFICCGCCSARRRWVTNTYSSELSCSYRNWSRDHLSSVVSTAFRLKKNAKALQFLRNFCIDLTCWFKKKNKDSMFSMLKFWGCLFTDIWGLTEMLDEIAM